MAHFEEKNTFCLNKSKFALGFTLFKHVKKKKIWVCLCSFLRQSIFGLKREVLCEFLPKCFKTTEMNSLAVCSSLYGEKYFLLIFISFYWFDQKKLFKQIQIFLRIYPFQTCLEKQTLRISVLHSDIATFLNKKRTCLWIPKKCFKTREKHSLAVCGSLWGKKHFFVNIFPIFLVWSKTVV